MRHDPVCGMPVDPATAVHRLDYQDTTYYFCSEKCKDSFHGAARRWAEQALADGRISLNDLKAPASSYTRERPMTSRRHTPS